MREKVLRYIREQALMRAGDRVAVAVSGGADSVALLRVLLDLRSELGIVLAAAHFNHGLRGEDAATDEAFVTELARALGLEFFAGRGNVRQHAFSSKLSIEAAGRELRYRWLAQLAQEQRLDCVATAHTLDDQAETVLLKFLRGAGTKGLAGIWPVVRSEHSGDDAGAKAPGQEREAYDAAKAAPLQSRMRSNSRANVKDGVTAGSAEAEPEAPPLQSGTFAKATLETRIVRPLLCVWRKDVEGYLESLGQSWREDESNHDRRFLRNRVRHELLPLLEREYNPNIRQVLGEAGDVLRAEEAYWQEQVERELAARSNYVRPAAEILQGLKPTLITQGANAGPSASLGQTLKANSTQISGPFKAEPRSMPEIGAGQLSLAGFAELPVAVQRRVLKRFAEDAGLALDFEHIANLRRCALGEMLRAELPGGRIALRAGAWLQLRAAGREAASAYRHVLPVPGEVRITEAGLILRATIAPEEFARELPAEELLNPDLLGAELVVRNWRPGDRFWPAHSRSQEKLKRLFAEKRIPAEQRPMWPVVLHEDEIIWVRDFPVARTYRWAGRGEAARIEAVRG